MTRSRMQNWASLLSSTLVALGSILGHAATAQADESVVVLGLTSIDGDDQYAQALTGALRHAATAVRGWQVSERDVALANLELVAGCEASESGCLTQIASTVGAQRLVYGTITRTGGDHYEFAISVYSYNATSNEVEEHVDRTLSSSRTDIDDLREPARAIIEQLAHVQHVGSIRVTASPGQPVTVDGAQVGTTDSNGVYVAAAVPSGSHQLVVGGGEARTVMVSDGAESAVTLGGGGGGGGGGSGGGGPSIDWLAISLLGVAVIGVVGMIVSWAELSSLSGDQAYNDYRMGLGTGRYGGPPLMGDVACQDSSIGLLGTGPMASHIHDVCSQGNTFEILQYVFLGVAVAAGATGTVLLVLDSSNSHAETPVSFVPSFGPNYGAMTMRMRF